MSFARIEDAIAAVARGEMVVVVDDEDRENEGDLIMAAEFATPEAIAFFLHHTSGLICVSITAERAAELDLGPMVLRNTETQRTAFLVSVDLRDVTTTGISASDRAATIRGLIDPSTQPDDLLRPGHIFPLQAREGGVLKRAGHTEATVDLARLAGCRPAGVLCEIVDESKHGMARRADLETFAARHGLFMISIAELIRYRRRTEQLVERVDEADHPHGVGPVPVRELPEPARRRGAPGVRAGRRGRRRRRARAGAQRVHRRRRVRVAPLRLRAAAARRACAASPARTGASSCTCGARRAAASTPAARSRPVRWWPTTASTASAPRCWSTSASAPCGS